MLMTATVTGRAVLRSLETGPALVETVQQHISTS